MAYKNPNLLPVNGSTFEGGTHAWTAGSNTTLSVNTGGTIDGTYSVRFTATAAGSVSATSPRFAVTAGTEYVVYNPIRIGTASAGKVATVTVTWYNAPAGGSSLGTVSNSVNLPNATGWQPSYYPVVIGTAPAGAQSAAITLSVSGMAAAEFINIDAVYAGETYSRDGNAFGFNTAFIEQDTSGWKVDNATLARVSGTLGTSDTGYFVLAATSDAAGFIDLRSMSFIGTIPGRTCAGYALIRASWTGTGFIEMRWYDSSWDEIAVDQQPIEFTADANQRVGICGTAPANAAYAKMFIRPEATSAGQVFYLDDAIFRTAVNFPGNLLSYNDYSAEAHLQDWAFSGVTARRAAFTSGVTDGYFAVELTPQTTGILRGDLQTLVPVTPGEVYRVEAVLWRHNPNTAQTITCALRVLIDWYDADGNPFQADEPDQFYSSDSSSEWVWYRVSETRVCPEGAAYARLVWEIDHPAGGADLYYVDNFSVTVSDPEYVLDVSNERGCITLTVYMAPPYGTGGTVSVYRVNQDGSMVPLRGYGFEYDRAPFTSVPLVIEDYEAPLGESVWYKIDWYDTNGDRSMRGYTRSVNTPVLDDPDYVWFKSPGLPAYNTRVMIETPPTWGRESRSTTYSVVGRRNPVHVTGKRAGRTAQISLLAWDWAANELFDRLLDSGQPALIQAMPGYGLDGNLYISIGDTEVESVTGAANDPGWRWKLSVTEIDRPHGGLQGSAGLTWQDIADGYETWEAVFDAHDSWATVLTEG